MYINSNGQRVYAKHLHLKRLYEAFGNKWATTPECQDVIARSYIHILYKEGYLDTSWWKKARPWAHGGEKLASYYKISSIGIAELLNKFGDIEVPPELRKEVAKYMLVL